MEAEHILHCPLHCLPVDPLLSRPRGATGRLPCCLEPAVCTTPRKALCLVTLILSFHERCKPMKKEVKGSGGSYKNVVGCCGATQHRELQKEWAKWDGRQGQGQLGHEVQQQACGMYLRCPPLGAGLHLGRGPGGSWRRRGPDVARTGQRGHCSWKGLVLPHSADEGTDVGP